METNKRNITEAAWDRIAKSVSDKIFLQLDKDDTLNDEERNELATLKAEAWMRERFTIETAKQELERLREAFCDAQAEQ